ncbi:Hypothetical protein FKW44_021634, partial [Caligus rogercresseyi]
NRYKYCSKMIMRGGMVLVLSQANMYLKVYQQELTIRLAVTQLVDEVTVEAST